MTHLQYLAAIERGLNGRKIAGVNISTWLDRMIASRINGPDGTFFGIMVEGDVERWQGGTTDVPINPNIFHVFYFERVGGKKQIKSGVLNWTITNPQGNVVHSQTSFIDPINNPASQFIKLPSWNFPGTLPTWPEGGYKIRACIDGVCRTAFYGVLKDLNWMYGGIIVFANGPEFDQFASTNQIVPDGSNIQVLPGLVWFKNTSTPRKITAFGETREFPNHRYLTPVYYLTRHDQPALDGVVDGASFSDTNLARNSFLSLFGYAFCQGDPEPATSLPLLNSACNNRMKVWFTDSAGRKVSGPIHYASGRQINVLVPQDLTLGIANVQVELGQTLTPPRQIEIVEASPKIFMVAPNLGAIVFQSSRIVSENDPALADEETMADNGEPIVANGDVLSLYAMGVGPVSPDAPFNQAAPNNPLSQTILPVKILVDGIECPVLYSGLAPGFVGLYQINFRISSDVPSGMRRLQLLAGETKSNTVPIAVQ